MNNDINLDYGGNPLDENKLKENFNTLKESFPEIYFNYGCDHCTKEVRDKREGYCKDCMIWQESPSLENSILTERKYGILKFWVEDRDYVFITTNNLKKITPEEHKSIVSMWNYGVSAETVAIMHTLFSTFDIVFIPKILVNRHPDWVVNSVKELLTFYDLYRKIPNVILYHDIHGKNFTENSYLKLELIK